MKISTNHSPYMKKFLRKTIVKRTQHQTKHFKNQTEKDNASFKKWVNPTKTQRKKYYENLNIKMLLITLNFEKLLYHFSQIKLIGLRRFIWINLTKSFLMTVRWLNNYFFVYVVKPLSLKTKCFTLGETSNLNNLAIKKFESHPSILIMTEIFPLATCVSLNIAKFLKFYEKFLILIVAKMVILQFCNGSLQSIFH